MNTWGTSARNVVAAAGVSGSCPRSAMTACTCFANVGTSCPLLAWRLSSIPEVEPSPGISGRLKPKASASFIPHILPLSRARIASTEFAASRSSQGLSEAKIVAPFG
jgi:hypothetical protein